MPGILGERLAGTEFMWPQKEIHILGVDFTWSLPGYNVLYAPAVYNLLVTFITGGVSMVIFFFVFKIIFPEGEKK